MTSKMNAGMLDKRLQLVTVSRAPDGKGGWNETETTVGDVWCSVAEKMSRRLNDEGKLLMARYYEVRTRHRSDLVSGERMLYGSQKLGIESVEHLDPPGQWLKLTCSEVK